MSEREIVLRLNAMGDILLAVPVLRALAANNSEVHLVMHQRWHDLAAFIPANVHLYTGTGGLLKLVAELKTLQPRAVYDLQGKLASIAIRTMLAAPITRVYQKRSMTEQFHALRGHYPLRIADDKPVWHKYGMACGVELHNPDPRLNFTESYLRECEELADNLGLIPENFVALHPQASKPGKEFPAELTAALQKHSSRKIALIGTGTTPIELFNSSVDLRNKISLYHLPGILKLARAVISSDSGPMHLARSVETPVAAIFFQTCPSLGFSPVPGKNVMVLSQNLSCKPCSLHGQNSVCPEKHFKCRQIDVKQTVESIMSFLENLA